MRAHGFKFFICVCDIFICRCDIFSWKDYIFLFVGVAKFVCLRVAFFTCSKVPFCVRTCSLFNFAVCFFYLEVRFLFICVYFFICKVSLVSHRRTALKGQIFAFDTNKDTFLDMEPNEEFNNDVWQHVEQSTVVEEEECEKKRGLTFQSNVLEAEGDDGDFLSW